MSTHPLLQIDAFTDRPFSGNPAAVCLLDAPAEAAWMQAVAAEMNLSETAFVHAGEGAWHLRWFTPTVEVPLCGHATLATAHALWEEGRGPAGAPLRFETRSGRLTATRAGGRIELDFPADPPERDDGPGVAEALGVTPRWIGRTRLAWLVEVGTADEVRSARPDFAALDAAACGEAIVTARSDDERWDVISRFFAPGAGIPEDPVTGAAHCAIGPYWGSRLGRAELRCYQASARGGELVVRPRGDRVTLSGRAVTVLRGELRA